MSEGSNRNVAVKTLSLNLKTQNVKPGQTHKLKSTEIHELRLSRRQAQSKKPEHTYLKFLTPLITSAKKIVDVYWLT